MPESTCSEAGCDGESVTDGLCGEHHTEARKALLVSIRGRASGPLARFWAYADRSGGPDACWPWTGSVHPSGYGDIFVNGGSPRLQKAHRWAYERFVGPIPEGLEIDHTCHTKDCPTPGHGDPHRKCVNPRHLEAVDRPTNIQRSTAPEATHAYYEAYREDVTQCPKGHEFTPENTQWRTTKTGKLTRRCAQCNRENVAAWRLAKFASGELTPAILAELERERQRKKREAA